ncbi:glycosyltransferase [Candidatus Saccharibacteria bacterium]|nr:glycosyltransferase [Candidatus Saccharibacteria bacterium]
MKKKILHILGGLDHGGAEAYLVNSLRNIDHSKYEFGVVTFMPPREGDKYAYEDELKAMGVKLYRVTDTRFKNPRKFEADIAKIVKDGNYGIVHSHIDFMSALSLTGAKKGGAKVRIAHSHNTNNTKINSKKMRLISAVLRKKLNRVATVRVACGEAAGEFLFGKGKPFTVIHNGIDLNRFRFNANTRHKMREKCGFDDDAIILLNIGRLEAQKNQEHLIDIFGDYSRKHKNAYLMILGDGSLRKTLEDKIAGERLGEKVLLMPPQSDTERYYAMADIFMLPSLFEGVPTVGIEAQASGLKCLFSDKVPAETKLIDSTEFIPLDGDWLGAMKPAEDRGAAVKDSRVKAYDIKETVKKLEEVYDK